jgi:hypothetical protein
MVEAVHVSCQYPMRQTCCHHTGAGERLTVGCPC